MIQKKNNIYRSGLNFGVFRLHKVSLPLRECKVQKFKQAFCIRAPFGRCCVKAELTFKLYTLLTEGVIHLVRKSPGFPDSQISNTMGITGRTPPFNEAVNLFEGIKNCILNQFSPIRPEFCGSTWIPAFAGVLSSPGRQNNTNSKFKPDRYNVAFISYFCYNNQTIQTEASLKKTTKG